MPRMAATGPGGMCISIATITSISLVIDGRSVPSSVAATEAASDWLTIEPPADGPVEFRNLMVNW